MPSIYMSPFRCRRMPGWQYKGLLGRSYNLYFVLINCIELLYLGISFTTWTIFVSVIIFYSLGFDLPQATDHMIWDKVACRGPGWGDGTECVSTNDKQKGKPSNFTTPRLLPANSPCDKSETVWNCRFLLALMFHPFYNFFSSCFRWSFMADFIHEAFDSG